RSVVRPALARRQEQAELFPDGVFVFALGQGRRAADIVYLRHIALAAQHTLDDAVRGQVGVAAYGRGEMRVVFIGEAEMPGLLGTVYGLLQRTQAHGLDDLEVGPGARRLDQARIVGRARVVAAFQHQAQVAQIVAQRLQLFRR